MVPWTHSVRSRSEFKMTWIYILLFLLVVFVLFRTLVKSPGRGISMYEFEHWVHSFAKIKKEGGTMTFRHSGSPSFIRFRRGAGCERRCQVLVDVPRTSWSESKLGTLHERLERMGIDAKEPAEDLGVLLRVTLEIPDTWDEASGAAGARISQELFAALGIGGEARFDVSMKGENSLRPWGPTIQRWQEEGNPVLRRIGRKIGEGVEREVESERSAPSAPKPNG